MNGWHLAQSRVRGRVARNVAVFAFRWKSKPKGHAVTSPRTIQMMDAQPIAASKSSFVNADDVAGNEFINHQEGNHHDAQDKEELFGTR